MDTKARKIDFEKDYDEVRALRERGVSWRDIGDKFDVSGQRVQQIFGEEFSDITTHRTSRHELEPEIVQYLEDYGPLPKKKIFDKFTVSESQLARMDLPRNLILSSRQGGSHFSDDDISRAVRACAKQCGEPLTSAAYLEWHRNNKDQPSLAALHLRRTWTETCQMAGVTPGVTRRKHYGKKYSKESALQCLAIFEDEMRKQGLRPTYARYEEFQRSNEGWPSGTTLRTATGMRWVDAIMASAEYAS